MYKAPPSKRKKKILKTLALTRRILFSFLKDLNDPSVPKIFSHRLTYDDIYAGRGYRYENEQDIERARTKRAIYQLKHDKFVKVRNIGDRVYCVLTDKGLRAALKEGVRLAEPLPNGECCLISFDVPEQEKGVRQQLRLLLKELGFVMDHQSLWMSDLDVFDPLTILLKEMDIFKWVHMYRSKMVI